MTATRMAGGSPRRRIRRGRVALHAFLITMSLIWIFPLAWCFFTALRPLSDTILHGYFSWPTTLNFQNFIDGWTNANLGYYYLNTLIVAVPAVIITLLLASLVAFALTRVRSKVNLFLLMMFTAGNLLPPQGDHRSALPDVPGDPDPEAAQRQRSAVRPIHRDHPDPRRLPGRVLHLRPEQLHADVAQGAQRGGPRRRCLALPDLPQRRAAALRAGPGGPRYARVHIHRQRLLLGPAADRDGLEAADHVGLEQPAGRVLNELQHPGGRCPDGRNSHDHRV